MAILKVCGIETEYGIVTRGFDVSPVTSSSMLINAYAGSMRQKIGWDFLDEHPSVDARGTVTETSFPPEIETHLVNAVLTNGARYYVDHAHPEVSTPECLTPRDVVLYDRAAEEIILRSIASVNALLPDGQEIGTFKNNSDGKGNSYGCHENYLVSRELAFGRLASHITTHFVTRQIYCGAGKVGSENGAPDVPFQISQRADFFEEEVGLETTVKRPIVNTRDEPHCDPLKYRRLHVIVGDANMSEVATFLKVGTTALILAMIEDDQFPDWLTLRHPVAHIRSVSHDISLTSTCELQDGRTMSALEIQEQLLGLCQRYVHRYGDPTSGDADEILREWESVLDCLKNNPEDAADRVDWIAKRRVLEGFALRHGVSPLSAQLRAIDLQYHDMRLDKCLALRVGLRTLVSIEDVHRAVTNPPPDTRAYFRGTCLARWPQNIVAANWDSIVIDTGDEILRRIPMMEPLKGTRAIVGELLTAVNSVEDLLLSLGSADTPGWDPLMTPEPGW
ncbi:MAG: depupylase/deamidase Dop [Actinobacteria bacterium]|nr:depupylase/deamidase Dop [Actinomycetota bacterium]